jgi:cyclic-di-GMP-binding protein
MLNFIAPGKAAEPNDEFGPERLREWLNALPTDPGRAAKALIEHLLKFNRAPMHGRLRLRLLDMFRDHLEWLLPQLEKKLADATPPVSGPLRQHAHTIEKLLKEAAAGYAHVVLAVPRSWLNLGFRAHLHVAMVRAMEFHARRLALSHRLYARAPGGVWSEMHALYRLAREWNLDERDAESPHTSPGKLYRASLLLAFAQPGKLRHGDFPRVQGYIAQYGELARIADARPTEAPTCLFAVDPFTDRPGAPLPKRPDGRAESGSLLLDTRALVDRVDTQLRRLNEGVAPGTLGLPHEAALPAYRELLERLLANWRGERRTRSARMQFHPRVDMWVGLREIWRVLRHESPADAGDTARASYGMPPATQWIVLNESARGFALKFMSGTLAPINVGEVVGVRTRDRGITYVCLVRWILSNSPEHFEVGLQQLGPVVVPAVYRPEESDRVAPEPVLFFPEMPAQRHPSTVVAPANRLVPQQNFSLRHRRGRMSLVASRVLEKTASIELLEVAAT